MGKKIRVLIASGLLAAPLCGFGTKVQGDLDVVQTLTALDKLAHYYQNLPNYCVKFSYQAISPPDVGGQEQIEGRLTIQGQRYRLELPGQTTYMDGKTIWVHVYERGQPEEVTISDYSPDEEGLNFTQIYSLHKEGYAPVDRYTVKKKRVAYTVIELAPIQEEKVGSETNHFVYQRIKITLADNPQRLLAWSVTLEDGMEEMYTVQKFKVGSQRPVSYFQFDHKKHPQVTVVDLTQEERFTVHGAA